VSGLNDLTIAVPRGALFDGTVDLLAGLGLETGELRGNDRKLLFEEIGVITMRPSDVPTYVEAGAADLGITGKDVLAEQVLGQQPLGPGSNGGPGGAGGSASGREVYELLDLGYGRCTMVLATTAGEPDPAAEALRRLGVMRVATKYPRIAARHLEETGRQAEIVEVKGSVELAPLTGLVEAIVDLTATGTTLRENNLVIREQILECTARLIANPVAHKLKAAAIDDLLERLRAA
jgi:ATP phosphoribosyltransferase